MSFMSLEQREQLFEIPESIRGYSARRDWTEATRERLGFPANSYADGLILSISKRGAKTDWAVWKQMARRWDEVKIGEPGERGDLQYAKDLQECSLVAEGTAGSREEAWDQACVAMGTDRLEIGSASHVRDLRSARHKLKEFDRIAGLQVETTTAARKRYLYGETGRSNDYLYAQSAEYRARIDRFCFSRYEVTRETKLFLFVDLNSGEEIDADGVLDPEAGDFRLSNKDIRRVSKGAFHAIEDTYDAIGCAWVGRGWRSQLLWLKLEDLVADYKKRRQEWAEDLQTVDTSINWRRVLGVPAEAQIGPKELQRYYRKAALKAHPDTGGTNEAFIEVQAAWKLAQRLVVAT